jgi:hypothetical protein
MVNGKNVICSRCCTKIHKREEEKFVVSCNTARVEEGFFLAPDGCTESSDTVLAIRPHACRLIAAIPSFVNGDTQSYLKPPLDSTSTPASIATCLPILLYKAAMHSTSLLPSFLPPSRALRRLRKLCLCLPSIADQIHQTVDLLLGLFCLSGGCGFWVVL